MQRRFTQASSAYSTFFDDNYVAWLLGLKPDGSGSVLKALCVRLGRRDDEVRSQLLDRAARYLPVRKDRKVGRQHSVLALQLAALSLLAEQPGTERDRAQVILQLLEGSMTGGVRGAKAPAGSERWLEEPTFFTELRERPGMASALCLEPTAGGDFRSAFRERELRRLLLSSMARLGHAFIDLYCLAVKRIGSMRAGARESEDLSGLMRDYLDLLERQQAGEASSDFGCFKELAAAADQFDLVLDVNAPDLRTMPLPDAARFLGTFLGEQQPIGGMFGQINQTLIRQFRMPGYPLVLITTDLLQEGEDLHTFCSAVHHYGISWMPSSMEQRVGRIDRVNSQTERRLTRLSGEAGGDLKLQVYYPHLSDTVEVLQVRRVLGRLNRFLRLMHRDLGTPDPGEQRIDISHEIHRLHDDIQPITESLHSAFPVRDEVLQGTQGTLAVDPKTTARLLERFDRVKDLPFKRLQIGWEAHSADGTILGTARLKRRQQPFALIVRSMGGRLVLRCISPIGLLTSYDEEQVAEATRSSPVHIAAVYDPKFESYNLATGRQILLGAESGDVVRIEALIEEVVQAADDLEEALLQTDQPLATFREDLYRESDDA